jgi:hypothetical protein
MEEPYAESDCFGGRARIGSWQAVSAQTFNVTGAWEESKPSAARRRSAQERQSL